MQPVSQGRHVADSGKVPCHALFIVSFWCFGVQLNEFVSILQTKMEVDDTGEKEKNNDGIRQYYVSKIEELQVDLLEVELCMALLPGKGSGGFFPMGPHVYTLMH